MKVAIIGFGYWGKILYKNLKSLPEITSIKICDPLFSGQKIDGVDEEIDSKYYDYDVDSVFVVVPATYHKSVVEHFLNKKINVFCEKPLCTNINDVRYLYKLANDNNCNLFVDWIFTFNDQVNKIKKGYKNGDFGAIKNIEMNRLNFGPVRNDVNACWDLASHDVSIVQYIFEDDYPEKIEWLNFKRDGMGNQDDTCIGLLKYSNFDCIINASWQYGNKFRKCIFEFEKGFLVWDDKKSRLEFDGVEINVEQKDSPLANSIREFIKYCQVSEISYDQQKLTESITRICSK
jgi:predicted dehydrogenase